MSGIGERVKEKFKGFALAWPSYAAVGSFVLYLIGYLAVRFHLTALGVGTDLTVLDERYLFTGARFFVYLVSAVPTIILIVGVPVGLAAIGYRILPKARRERIEVWWQARKRKNGWAAVFGIIWSVAMIQLAMKQCFFFSNLLVRTELPQPAWLSQLMLDDSAMALYFICLIAGTAVPALILFALRKTAAGRTRFLAWLLGFLVLVQFLFLPVNYGVFIVDKHLPRVRNTGTPALLSNDQDVWLVWEGQGGMTFLVQRKNNSHRELLTVRREEVKAIAIEGSDAIFKRLFDP